MFVFVFVCVFTKISHLHLLMLQLLFDLKTHAYFCDDVFNYVEQKEQIGRNLDTHERMRSNFNEKYDVIIIIVI